ncbi:uncharacterized protein LOC126427135 [Schistocerca serialis cubense]|uniref:uncharacterized protein LOC126427135 n=1 Tax=Schistocerca serialis cubense TaxID=2023355 RepID=UPI00214E1EEA|nr:uncharacterized protein LOC126427135 [Schistocerca serialis cubense]
MSQSPVFTAVHDAATAEWTFDCEAQRFTPCATNTPGMFVSPVFASPGRTTLTSAGIPHRALYTSSQTPSTAFYAQQNAPSAQDPGNPEFLPHSMDHAAGQFLGPHARLPFNVPPFPPVEGTLTPTVPDHLYAYPSFRPAHTSTSGDAPAVVPPRHSALSRDLAPAAPCLWCGRTDSVPRWTGYHVSPTQLTDVQRNTSPATEAHFAPVNTVQNPRAFRAPPTAPQTLAPGHVSVIPPTFSVKDTTPTKLSLRAASKATLRVKGLAKLPIELIPGKQLTWSFYVADVEDPVLGIDFLFHFRLSPDLQSVALLHHTSSTHIACSVASSAPPPPRPPDDLGTAPIKCSSSADSLTISTAHLQPERPAVDDLRPHNVERNRARSSATQALTGARRLVQRLPTSPPPDTGDAPRGTLSTPKQTASLAHKVSDSCVLPIPVHDGPKMSSPAKLNAITNGTTHKIVTTDGPPVRHKACRLPPHKLRLAKAAVEERLRTDIRINKPKSNNFTIRERVGRETVAQKRGARICSGHKYKILCIFLSVVIVMYV